MGTETASGVGLGVGVLVGEPVAPGAAVTQPARFSTRTILNPAMTAPVRFPHMENSIADG